MRSSFLIFFMLIFGLSSCNEELVFTPKPRAFPKINFPERSFQEFDMDFCQFSFEYPSYAQIQKDTLFFDETPVDPCWFDLYVPVFDAKVHCSYYPIDKQNTLEKLQSDAFNLANKHNIKANYIDELPLEKPNGVSGFVFSIEGPVASPFQFYLTDQDEKHFLRGSLYFNTQSRPDSLAPVFDFMKEDLMHLINTFAWKK